MLDNYRREHPYRHWLAWTAGFLLFGAAMAFWLLLEGGYESFVRRWGEP